jgi:Flp pilus assembly protein CpaB
MKELKRKKMTTPNVKTQKNSFFKGRKMWFWIAAGSGIITLILLVVFLSQLISTTSYYVLNKDVPSRTLVTPDMLEEVPTSKGTEPKTALTLADVSSGEVYTKVELNTGDILTASNAGELIPLRAGLPEDFVIASFTAAPNDSAGGNITRGDYVDIFLIGEGEEEQSSLIFQRVLIVDASTDVSSGGDETVTSTDETATAPYRVGIPSLYTVGLTQEEAGKLSLALNSGRLYVVLSSKQSVTDGATEKTFGVTLPQLLLDGAGDSGEGTDNSFGEVESDSATGTPGATPTPVTPTPEVSQTPESSVTIAPTPEVEEG